MKELKASTKAGQRVIEMGENCIYSSLYSIYTSFSRAKERAFELCEKMFAETENARCFGVGNANTFGFTASWYGTKDGENIFRVETKDNSYLVWLDR